MIRQKASRTTGAMRRSSDFVTSLTSEATGCLLECRLAAQIASQIQFGLERIS
jgi:hypothetical protein